MSSKFKRKISSVSIRTIVPILLVLSLFLSGGIVVIDHFDLFGSTPLFGSNSNESEDNDPSHGYVSSDIVINAEPTIVNKDKPYSLKGATLTPGKDFLVDSIDLNENTAVIDGLMNEMSLDRLNTVNVRLNFDGGLICNTPFTNGKCDGILSYIYGLAKTKQFNVSLTVDIGLLADTHVATVADIEKISAILSSNSIINNCDMLVIEGYTLKKEDITYSEYLLSGSAKTFSEYCKDRLSAAMNAYYSAVLDADCTLYTGIYIDSEMFTGDCLENMLDAESSSDVVTWLHKGYADFCIVDNSFSTLSTPLDFESVVDFWNSCSFNQANVYFEIDYSKVGQDIKGWTSPDQVVKQLMVLGDKANYNFTLSSYSDFLHDNTESRQAVQKFIAGQISLDYVLSNLNVTSPKSKNFTTYNDTVALIGASDPQFTLTLNGETLERNKYGYFSLDLKLNLGANRFVIEHKGSTEVYNITYKKVIIKEYAPTKAETVAGGSSVVVSIQGISGSKVTATLNGTTITLNEEVILDIDGNVAGEYSNYTGRFTVPHFYDKDTSLGNIKFTVASKYGTESVTAAKITVKKSASNLPAETPAGGQYVEVSGSTIAEVTREQAEVFNIHDNDDWSRPTNNYLPAGTVDHCSASTTTVDGSALRTLRYGKMLYNSNLKVTNGTLPSTNSVKVSSFTTGSSHTKLTLNLDWKAPFLFHIGPQSYRNEGAGDNRDYTMKEITFNYIDITFCYATDVGGDISIPDGNLIFKKAEWIKNTSDHTLRLHLKKTGSFYGWYAYYNNAGQLVFEFLNPARITLTNNAYGADLTGVTIMIDAGHGGNDQGALGSNKNFTEAYLNLVLAKEVKAQLESIGATVIMTRDSDVTLDSTQRISMVRQKKPDYILSIHRNAVESTTPNAFTTYHFNAFQANAAITMYESYNKYPADSIFPVSKWSGTKWHPFFLSRTTNCPVVLTENGFITNPGNFELMIDPDFNRRNAKALTQGIVDYFKSIQ